jgi:hypothetical protein
MGYYKMVVFFPCRGKNSVPNLAERIRSEISDAVEDVDAYGVREVFLLLDYIRQGKGITGGPKGEMFTWGVQSVSPDVDRFVKVLLPFWTALLSHPDPESEDWDGPHSYAQVFVLWQEEGMSRATAVEIARRDPRSKRPLDLTVSSHDLPFSLWGRSLLMNPRLP